MKYVVVTGASSGIGRGSVKVLIEKGFHVFGSVRKQVDADNLIEEFGDNVTPLIFAATDVAAVKEAADKVKNIVGDTTLSGLVNNAGVAVTGPMMHIPIEEFRYQMEVNTVGPIIAIQAFLPLLGAVNPPVKNPGRIINITSMAGVRAAPFFGPYSASKHALEAISGSLRQELMLYGVDVIIIGPGAVATPIWNKAEQVDNSQYDNTDYKQSYKKMNDFMSAMGPQGIPIEKVGELVHHTITTDKPKVRYAIAPNMLTDWLIPQNLPKRMLDNIIAGKIGLQKIKK
ncbi:MAG: NAD(P)-dependent dehydrogenase (short-subunit alcohol dehydrogenase family) [Flavobacteriales bacterium]|jgi:NAD(P)-dependent dehydrogenase (short-subunit alcohol dehydrogenase family)